jgi:hypothetical protein
MWMRVRRQGDVWTQFYSFNGTSFTQNTSFTHAMTVTSVGVFAGNAAVSGTPPAFTCLVDYFFNTASPISSEDGGSVPADGQGPLIQLPGTSFAAGSEREVHWVTDEPADGEVRFGTTTAYELGSVTHSNDTYDHSLTLTGLSGGTTYHYQIVTRDPAGNASTSGDFTFVQTGGGSGPQITVWYGNTQTYGTRGVPQNFVNVVGNFSSPAGVSSMSYRLNGGSSRSLSLGPDSRRLADLGDFNADIHIDDLQNGANSVVFQATDGQGTTLQKTVTVNFTDQNIWPLPYTANWTGLSSPSDILTVGQVVDGFWQISGGKLRPIQLDYDRLVAIGDLTWTDYEIVCPITIHSVDPDGFLFPSNRPAVGFIFRWTGHTTQINTQPLAGFLPLGGLGWYIFSESGSDQLQILGNNLVQANKNRTLAFGTEYMFKFRVENNGSGPLYSLKVWQSSNSEPGPWDVQLQQSHSDPQNGCVLFVAHHVDASFGNATVTAVP